LEGKLAGLHIFSFNRYAIGLGQVGFILPVKTYIQTMYVKIQYFYVK